MTEDRRPKFGSPPIHIVKAENEGHGLRVAAGILIPLILILFAVTAYYMYRRRRSGKFNVRFVKYFL